jgi:hypothetical protein
MTAIVRHLSDALESPLLTAVVQAVVGALVGWWGG